MAVVEQLSKDRRQPLLGKGLEIDALQCLYLAVRDLSETDAAVGRM